MSKIKSILILTLLLVPSYFSYALEVTQYPLLGGKGLSDNPTIVELVAYYFNFALIIGIIAAVGMVIYAAFNIVTAQGNPTQIADARNKMVGAGLGIVILFGAFLIVSTLNPEILNVKNIETHCMSGIQVIKTDSNNKQTETCITTSMANIDLSEATANWISKADTIPGAYVYTAENFQGTPAYVDNGTNLSNTSYRSIWLFDQEQVGFLLYDGKDYKAVERAIPLATTGSISDLSKFIDPKPKTEENPSGQSYDNIIKSIKVNNPSDSALKYNAVLFADPNYRGQCAFINTDVSDVSTLSSSLNNNTSSFLVVKSRVGTTGRGTVVLYDGINCPHDGGAGSQTITIPDSGSASGNISGMGYARSIDIKGPAGVILKSGDGRCQLWTLSDANAGTCISDIVGSSVYPTTGDSAHPTAYIVFPIDY